MGTIIQLVSDNFNFLLVYAFNRTRLRHILPQQTIEALAKPQVHIRPKLRIGKRSGKVARTLQSFVNQRMSAEPFSDVVGQRRGPGVERSERLDDRLTHQLRRLVRDLGNDRVASGQAGD